MEGESEKQQVPPWHTLPAKDCADALSCPDESGLSGEEARERLEQYGPNVLREAKKKSSLVLFLEQFNDFMIWVLLAAAIISGAVLQEFLDAGVIMVIVLLNAVLGFVQHKRAESAMEELKQLSAPTVKVVRDGSESEIPSRDAVPGDVMILETGDLVSADGRLLTAVNLRTDESSLTGESVPVDKSTAALDDPDTPVGDRYNMVFSGTHVEYGRGTALVIATGHGTQMGQIAELLEEAEPGPTPLQAELRDVGKRIVYICLIVVFLVFLAGIIRGEAFALMFLFAVSLAVAAIPEGLPAIVTITLAMGTQTMAQENAIVRSLPAVETLGCANYICSDKTGTLTLNRMTVVEAMVSDDDPRPIEDVSSDPDVTGSEAFKMANTVAALCCDARKVGDEEYAGDSTEVALLEAAYNSGYDKDQLEEKMPRVAEVPFDSDRKMMTTIHRDNGGYLFLAKGATEVLLKQCTDVVDNGGTGKLSPERRDHILEETVELGGRALRTISFAYGTADSLPSPVSSETVEKGLTFVGAYAMMDPPRPEAFEALELCRQANIDVAMITGDHVATAEAVGKELGLLRPGMRIVEGRELEEMSEEELGRQVEQIGVYARVSPRHKVKIVDALQSRDHVVAMTGDGVNDAPALKHADIGVAMGITGTDVSKEASDMVLADDNFATIVSAVRQGRIIFSNLKKFIYFLLSCNISEVLTMFIAMIAGFPLPLLPVQILWINLATDGLPALALGMEPPERNVMESPPRRQGENILAAKQQLRLLWQGAIITAGALAAFFLSHYVLGYSWNNGQLEMVQTVVFTTMVLSQLFHSFNWRSETVSFFREPPWRNRYLVGAFLISLGLQLAVLYIPFMQRAFHTHAPSATAWAVILACAMLPVLLIDRLKVLGVWLRKRESAASTPPSP